MSYNTQNEIVAGLRKMANDIEAGRIKPISVEGKADPPESVNATVRYCETIVRFYRVPEPPKAPENRDKSTVEMLQSMIDDINSGRIEPGAVLKKHGPESVSMTLYYRTIPQETPEQKAERLEAELETCNRLLNNRDRQMRLLAERLAETEQHRDRIARAGHAAANLCWNFGHNTALQMTEQHRQSAYNAAAEWDNALRNRSNDK